MANKRYEGVMRVFWVPSIANISAPTVAEIDGGTEITSYVTKDGLSTNPSFNKIDTGNLSTAFDSEIQGSWGLGMQLTLLRDDTTDTAWDLFTSHGTAGNVVKLPFKGSGTVAAADVAEVYPAEASIAIPDNTAANARQTATVDIAVTDEPDLNAAVAA